ncbi:DUF167 domain-containing protein [Candidatus Peregrinibacteria bacterium]|nr:DUF167 domain-containing protein [Candidatus Peregrinibacteria bacterium]
MDTKFFQEILARGVIALKVIPRAKKTEIVGKMADGTWKIRIASVPENGKANVELLKFLKKKGNIHAEIIQGEKERKKIIKLLLPPASSSRAKHFFTT